MVSVVHFQSCWITRGYLPYQNHRETDHRIQYYPMDLGISSDPPVSSDQRVDLRENLQETIDFPIEIWDFPVIFPLNQSIDQKPPTKPPKKNISGPLGTRLRHSRSRAQGILRIFESCGAWWFPSKLHGNSMGYDPSIPW